MIPHLSKMATCAPVQNHPRIHCKSLSIEYIMYVYELSLLFDFETLNLQLVTIFTI